MALSIATTMIPKTVYLEAQERAQQFAHAHATTLAREILDWHTTAKLRGEKLRELAGITHAMNPVRALDLAEHFAVTAALQLVVAQPERT